MEVKDQLGESDSDASTVPNLDLPEHREEEFEDSQQSGLSQDDIVPATRMEHQEAESAQIEPFQLAAEVVREIACEPRRQTAHKSFPRQRPEGRNASVCTDSVTATDEGDEISSDFNQVATTFAATELDSSIDYISGDSSVEGKRKRKVIRRSDNLSPCRRSTRPRFAPKPEIVGWDLLLTRKRLVPKPQITCPKPQITCRPVSVVLIRLKGVDDFYRCEITTPEVTNTLKPSVVTSAQVARARCVEYLSDVDSDSDATTEPLPDLETDRLVEVGGSTHSSPSRKKPGRTNRIATRASVLSKASIESSAKEKLVKSPASVTGEIDSPRLKNMSKTVLGAVGVKIMRTVMATGKVPSFDHPDHNCVLEYIGAHIRKGIRNGTILSGITGHTDGVVVPEDTPID